MAKSTKHLDGIKAYDEFRAPWETEGGTDAEIDKPKLKRYIYNLVTDKAKAQDSREDALEAAQVAETERDEAKTEAANANPAEAQKKIDKLEKQVADLTAERDGLVQAKEQADLRAEVLGDLDPKYAKYVTGTTKEELEKSLEDVRKDFGLEAPGDDDDDEDGDDDEPTLRSTPQRRSGRLLNPADAQNGKGGEGEYDFDAVADSIVGGGYFR